MLTNFRHLVESLGDRVIIPDLAPLAWAGLVFATLFVGIGKTALPGIVTLSVAIFAAILPARESTAALLILLLVGDLIAVWIYAKDADWAILKKLIPSVVVGVALGTAFLYFVSDGVMRRSIGIILLILTALTLLLMRRGTAETIKEFFARRSIRSLYGALGGFTTMAANSGGPVMNLYFIASGFDMRRFLGTQAWFFFTVNVIKLPFSAGIGLMTSEVLSIAALMIPIVIVGAIIGRLIVKRINQKLFNAIIIGLTIVSAVYLVF